MTLFLGAWGVVVVVRPICSLAHLRSAFVTPFFEDDDRLDGIDDDGITEEDDVVLCRLCRVLLLVLLFRRELTR